MAKTYGDRISEAAQLAEAAGSARENGLSGLSAAMERKARHLLEPIGKKRRRKKPQKKRKQSQGRKKTETLA